MTTTVETAPATQDTDLTYMGRTITLAEVDLTGLSSTRAVVAFVRVPVDDSWVMMPFGALTWDPTRHTIELVTVTERVRRHGLATRLHAFARHLDPALTHSAQRSPSGTKWARSIGDGPLPRNTRGLTDAQVSAMGAGLLAALHGFGPDDLIPPTT